MSADTINRLYRLIFAMLLPQHEIDYSNEDRLIEIPLSNVGSKNLLTIDSKSFTKVLLLEEDILEIEFLNDSDNVEINIQNSIGETAYEMQTFTTQTLHLIVLIKDWIPGEYAIYINNRKESLAFSGVFFI